VGALHSDGWNWSTADIAAMFQTAYQVLRDTGRRPGELVSLPADCLNIDQGEWALVYDNHKKRRLRRRLPITSDGRRDPHAERRPPRTGRQAHPCHSTAS
jgi:hypothetical protein